MDKDGEPDTEKSLETRLTETQRALLIQNRIMDSIYQQVALLYTEIAGEKRVEKRDFMSNPAKYVNRIYEALKRSKQKEIKDDELSRIYKDAFESFRKTIEALRETNSIKEELWNEELRKTNSIKEELWKYAEKSIRAVQESIRAVQEELERLRGNS